jgi:hypothetical protein
MHASQDLTLQITNLSSQAVNDLSGSFNALPETEHADGKYRLRRYSIVKLSDGGLEHLATREFVQSEEVNHFQGDVLRQFEAIEDQIIHSDGMLEMCKLFKKASQISSEQAIEIHQMRVTAIYEETKVSPEGIHQDGFDHVAVVGIDRHNITGGDFMIYNDNNEDPFLRKVLNTGEVALINDNILWHNAKPISAVKPNEQGHMDVFVLTTKEAPHELHA